MNRTELVNALRRMKVETGSFVCLGCGHENDCGVKGCAVLRAAAEELDKMRWVPVTERLPDKDGRTIVRLSRGGIMPLNFTLRRQTWNGQGRFATHWMELPEVEDDEESGG